ncbi:MAG TPA: heparin lyase I family protein [Candidatus Polarisedimenticolia bacterium]|nr:heparin lyase I family protein [Candidatus Polarisedimenticolia bacterium]
MKPVLQMLAIFVLFALLLLLVLRAIPIHVYDGFESPHLSGFRWLRRRFESGAVVSQTSVVRSGLRALAITVHSGDRPEAASQAGAATERDEIMEAWWLFSRAERTYVYSFSLYLPKDFPQRAERLVIAQWRQLCERTCVPDNPILALRYELGRLQVTRNDEHGKTLLYQGDEDVRGRWLDFRFSARWDRTAEGTVDATLDGRGILHYEGATIYQPGSGHPRYALIYSKTGLYRDALHEAPWTMYVDEYRKDQCDGTGCR